MQRWGTALWPGRGAHPRTATLLRGVARAAPGTSDALRVKLRVRKGATEGLSNAHCRLNNTKRAPGRHCLPALLHAHARSAQKHVAKLASQAPRGLDTSVLCTTKLRVRLALRALRASC